MTVTAAPDDERPHRPGPELRWTESWTFDFSSRDGALGGWARLVLLPGLGLAWYHAFLTGPGRQLVAVIDPEVPPPVDSLEIRTTGLWATHICESPHDHWTVGLEAFGVGLDDPAEVYGRQFGDQVPLGFDLEWEATGPVEDDSLPITGYQQPSLVTGEILVGREAIDFVGDGRREHHWGVWAGWDVRWFRLHGRLDDGTSFSAVVVGGDLAAAEATVDGQPVEVIEVRESMNGVGLPEAARVRLTGLDVAAEPIGATPLELTDPEGRVTRAPRALCRLTTRRRATGAGWAEWNLPLR